MSYDVGPTYSAVDVSTYTGYITSEYNQQPDFVATVSATCQPLVDLQNVLQAMPTDYDVDVAIGEQLDAVGLWVGISRYVDIPLTNVYFSFDMSGLGWDQGYWKGQYDPVTGVTALGDTTYRFVIEAKIAANSWDGTLAGAATALANIFNATDTPGTLLYIEDHQDLSMLYGIAGVVPPQIYLALLVNGYIPLVPGGIAVSYVQTTVSGSPVFGLDASGSYVAGLDLGAWATPITA